MTGLDLDSDTIMSVACYVSSSVAVEDDTFAKKFKKVTDYELNVLDEEGFATVIHHEQKALNRMGDWCKQHHGSSGLSAECLASTTSAQDAASRLLEYIKKHVKEPRTALLAGNSVHADAAFLRKSPFDVVTRFLHYRILDISAIKEAARRWAPQDTLKHTPQKKGLHEARADVLESIDEARFYKQAFFSS